jgi:thiamine-monophosphate kinase
MERTAKAIDLGERGLIKRITEILGGIDHDDCAVIEQGGCTSRPQLVATTDMLHRKTDFPEQASAWQIGWMTAAVNLSDIAAMGAEPLGLLIAAGIPPQTDLDVVDGIFRGLLDCADAFGTKILGGDMDAHEELTMTGCALGTVDRASILRRKGARPGDLLCTTGSLGGAGAGLSLLGMTDKKRMMPYMVHAPLVRRLLSPIPRLDEGRAIASSGAATCMMDNSDGLAMSLYDLHEAGGCGFVVEKATLPMMYGLEEAAGSMKEAIDLVLYAGGDYELLFTVRPKMLSRAMDTCEMTVIGRAVEEGIWISGEGGLRPLPRKGFEHMTR